MNTTNKVDAEYFSLLVNILNNGRRKKNRTGVDTIGVFGAMAKFDVDFDAFPILTTKRVWFKGIVHELLWFIKGDTNIKYLVDNDVHIWDSWAFDKYQNTPTSGLLLPDPLRLTNQEKRVWKENPEPGDPVESVKKDVQKKLDAFIQRIKNDSEFAKKWGQLGEGTYGGMWRDFPHFNKTYSSPHPGGVGDEYEREGIDQLQKVIDKLRTNPDDRRIIVSAWHPYWVDHCALPPCHCLFHFNTEELTHEERCYVWGVGEKGFDTVTKDELDTYGCPKRRLNLLLYQRSCDTFLGVPFNISSYSLLLAMVAHCVGMVPGTFTHTYGDLHIYENHLEQVNEQLSRTPKQLPKLRLNPAVRNLFDFKYEDICLEEYDPHATIKAPVAV